MNKIFGSLIPKVAFLATVVGLLLGLASCSGDLMEADDSEPDEIWINGINSINHDGTDTIKACKGGEKHDGGYSLSRLVKAGLAEKVKSGVYKIPNVDGTWGVIVPCSKALGDAGVWGGAYTQETGTPGFGTENNCNGRWKVMGSGTTLFIDFTAHKAWLES